jgi:serine acetyltransferase
LKPVSERLSAVLPWFFAVLVRVLCSARRKDDTHVEIEAGVGLTIDAGNGVVIEYKATSSAKCSRLPDLTNLSLSFLPRTSI